MSSKGKTSNKGTFDKKGGFNSILYLQNYPNLKNIEIDIKEAAKYDRLERLLRLATPKSIDTPQSCTSGDLKRCITNDLYNKIEQPSPAKSKILIEEVEEELIAPDLDRFDESSDNIIIDLQNDLESLNFQNEEQARSMPKTHSYFYPPRDNYKAMNQYSSLPNQIGFHTNGILPINPAMYFRPNNSEKNLLNFSNNPVTQNPNFISQQQMPQAINIDDEFTRLFKANDFKKEEQIQNTTTNETTSSPKEEKSANGKNIIKKTINNQDIKGWICIQCKNFNYESKLLGLNISENKMQ